METGKRRRVEDEARPHYAVFKQRRVGALVFMLLLLAALVLGLGAYLFSGAPEETSEDPPPEQVDTPVVEEEPPPRETAAEKAEREEAERRAAEEQAAREEEERIAAAAPDDPTLKLTVPRLGLYNHTVRNDDSETALDVGAIKIPSTEFPWQVGDTNTYIACHRLGFPGNESFNQCLNLPAVQRGDDVILTDANGRQYAYRVTEAFQATPQDRWVKRPQPGRDMVSLQTCIENIGDVYNLAGPNWNARYIVQADRVV